MVSRRCQRWRVFFRFSQHACSPSARHRCVLAHTVDPQPSLPREGGAERVQGHLSGGSGDDWHLCHTNSLQEPLRRQKQSPCLSWVIHFRGSRRTYKAAKLSCKESFFYNSNTICIEWKSEVKQVMSLLLDKKRQWQIWRVNPWIRAQVNRTLFQTGSSEWLDKVTLILCDICGNMFLLSQNIFLEKDARGGLNSSSHTRLAQIKWQKQ